MSQCDYCGRFLSGEECPNCGGGREDAPWRDEQTLRKLYVRKKLDMDQIADELGCTKSRVRYWMEKHGIERRSVSAAIALAKPPLAPRTNEFGYELVRTHVGGETKLVPVHRLVAVAEYGFDEVAGNVVHHRNQIPWDNRPANLEVMSDSAHKRYHAKRRNENPEPIADGGQPEEGDGDFATRQALRDHDCALADGGESGAGSDRQHVAVCGCGHVTDPVDNPTVALVKGLGHLDEGCREEYGVTVRPAEEVSSA